MRCNATRLSYLTVWTMYVCENEAWPASFQSPVRMCTMCAKSRRTMSTCRQDCNRRKRQNTRSAGRMFVPSRLFQALIRTRWFGIFHVIFQRVRALKFAKFRHFDRHCPNMNATMTQSCNHNFCKFMYFKALLRKKRRKKKKVELDGERTCCYDTFCVDSTTCTHTHAHMRTLSHVWACSSGSTCKCWLIISTRTNLSEHARACRSSISFRMRAVV